MHQEHDGHGGELLGERRETEIRDGVDLRQRSQVPNAVAALKDRSPILADEDGKPRSSCARKRGEDRIDLRGRRLLCKDTAGKQEYGRGSNQEISLT